MTIAFSSVSAASVFCLSTKSAIEKINVAANNTPNAMVNSL